MKAALTDPELSKADVAVLFSVLDRLNAESGEAYPALTTIAADAKVDRGHVTRCIRRLCDRGYLDRESGSRTSSNRYRMGPACRCSPAPTGRCDVAPRGECEPAPTGRCTAAVEVGADSTSEVGAALHPEPAFKSNQLFEPAETVDDFSLARVTRDAMKAFNSSELVTANGGKLSTVTDQGIDTKRKWIQRSLKTSREIAKAMGLPGPSLEFWERYFVEVGTDAWKRGDGPYTGSHANWRPSFEYLTRPAVMLDVWERACQEDEAA